MLVWELRRGLGTVYPLAQGQGLSRKEEGGNLRAWSRKKKSEVIEEEVLQLRPEQPLKQAWAK